MNYKKILPQFSCGTNTIKNNNSGFTIAELLGVIAILAILITVAVGSVIAMQSRIQTKMYCSKIELIEKAAVLYGQDIMQEVYLGDSSDATIVTVGELIEGVRVDIGNGEHILMGSYLEKDIEDPPYVVDPRKKNDEVGLYNDRIAVFLENKRVVAVYVDVESGVCGESNFDIPNDGDSNSPQEGEDSGLLGDLILTVTIDGESSNTFPAKGSSYVASSVICDKGATGIWNNESWSIVVSNLTQQQTTCNVAFVSNGNDTLAYKVLQQYGGKEAINVAPGSTFNNISTSTTNIMYKMEDDYGMSYYYRGSKTLLNNNLIFANHQWKIVRINGDGAVRIIYNGTCPNNSCTINSTGTSTQIRLVQFNPSRHDAKYVGYMYGGANGIASTSRVQAVTNETSSNAKIELESWYTTHIENKGYASYISDTLFCNDRRLQSEEAGGGSTTPSGFGTSNTRYAAHYRLQTNKTPTLLCRNKNDRFTVSEVNVGNGSLTYPVGLITADELALAGGTNNANNTSYYLYSNEHFLSGSPKEMIDHLGGSSEIWSLSMEGRLISWVTYGTPTLFGLRSVLNLNANTMVTGTGTEADPFKVIS